MIHYVYPMIYQLVFLLVGVAMALHLLIRQFKQTGRWTFHTTRFVFLFLPLFSVPVLQYLQDLWLIGSPFGNHLLGIFISSIPELFAIVSGYVFVPR